MSPPGNPVHSVKGHSQHCWPCGTNKRQQKTNFHWQVVARKAIWGPARYQGVFLSLQVPKTSCHTNTLIFIVCLLWAPHTVADGHPTVALHKPLTNLQLNRKCQKADLNTTFLTWFYIEAVQQGQREMVGFASGYQKGLIPSFPHPARWGRQVLISH